MCRVLLCIESKSKIGAGQHIVQIIGSLVDGKHVLTFWNIDEVDDVAVLFVGSKENFFSGNRVQLEHQIALLNQKRTRKKR